MIHKTFENNKHNIECMILTGVFTFFSTPELSIFDKSRACSIIHSLTQSRLKPNEIKK